jgi:hypothetical protein
MIFEETVESVIRQQEIEDQEISMFVKKNTQNLLISEVKPNQSGSKCC